MNEILKTLKKIEAPLLFIRRNEYRNISLIRDLEATISGYLDDLGDILLQSDMNASEGNGEYIKFISELKALFCDFDTLEGEKKKSRIESALVSIKQMRRLKVKEESLPSITGHSEKDIQGSFEKLSLSVQYVKGVGPKVASLLSKKGLNSVEDMLYFLPRRYEDRRFVKKISEAELGKKETVIGEVIDVRVQRYRRKGVFEVTFDDGSGMLTAKWFRGNTTYLRNTFKKGKRFFLTGEIRGYLFGKDMIHPDYEMIGEGENESLNVRRIIPVYSETEGLHQKYLRRIMKNVVTDYGKFTIDAIPDYVSKNNALDDLEASIRALHFPGFEEDIDRFNAFKSVAHRRIVFDEFFFFELGMAFRKKGYEREKGISFDIEGDMREKFCAILPFGLTEAQKRVIGEIEKNMGQEYPMNRLLQGDVGSGKTIVSMAAMIVAYENGYQSAIMAPTEILAEQHFNNMKAWAKKLGITVSLLTGGPKSKRQRETIEDIKNGMVNIVVGTHALIQEGITFKKLGLVVIDEQHRFGVLQRAILREKGMNPDVLVMTATPIPRTLAMTAYGDLDISVIDEMPPGKKPITTKVFYEKGREKVYEIIRKEVQKKNQVFIIYPLVEESEALDLKDATSMSFHLQEDIFPEARVGLIHGKMKSGEKNAIMKTFLAGNLDILVSTTVIEVGIDIPTASLMIVEHAERFGLSQLHQLRGRVGRGRISSSCILLAHHTGTEDSKKRLRIMEKTNDGFRISEEDLSIRGPGEFLGTRQSGLPDFRVASIMRDGKILNQARDAAFDVLEKDPRLGQAEHALLREVLLRRWGGRLDLAKTG
jgi:ATP-dependent DNA helicase RecG